ncbi:hypothetical protein [Mycobacteroides chelonae]|nr:hypothetical protein [Mycobacteroides chelonae]
MFEGLPQESLNPFVGQGYTMVSGWDLAMYIAAGVMGAVIGVLWIVARTQGWRWWTRLGAGVLVAAVLAMAGGGAAVLVRNTPGVCACAIHPARDPFRR